MAHLDSQLRTIAMCYCGICIYRRRCFSLAYSQSAFQFGISRNPAFPFVGLPSYLVPITLSRIGSRYNFTLSLWILSRTSIVSMAFPVSSLHCFFFPTPNLCYRHTVMATKDYHTSHNLCMSAAASHTNCGLHGRLLCDRLNHWYVS